MSTEEVNCLQEYRLDIEFPMGSFIFSQFDSWGSWEIIEKPNEGKVIIRLNDIPLIWDAVIPVCFEGLVQVPGVELHYKIYNPNTNDVAQRGVIVPDYEEVVGQAGSTTYLSDAINAGKLLPPAQADTAFQSVFIKGELVIDENYSFSSYNLRRNNIRMGENASITIQGNKELNIYRSDIYSCTNWDGIYAANNSNLSIQFSTLKNADVGIELTDGTSLISMHNKYENNRIAIGSFGNNYKEISTTFYHELYKNGEEGLHFENTSPQKIIGIRYFNYFVISSMSENGIYAYNTELILGNLYIYDCKNGVLAQYYELGSGEFYANNCAFSNADYGVTVAGYQYTSVTGSEFIGCDIGFYKLEGRGIMTDFIGNRIIGSRIGVLGNCHTITYGRIQDCDISSTQRCVLLYGYTDGDAKWSTQYNVLTLVPSTEYTSPVAVLYNTMHNARVFENSIDNNGGVGVQINGGSFNNVIRNSIGLYPGTIGIKINNSDIAGVICNDIYFADLGIGISGDCVNADIRGNNLQATVGLQYGHINQGFANTGPQPYKGNKFKPGSSSDPRAINYSTPYVATNNIYKISQSGNPSQGSTYYPYFIAQINNWFYPDSYISNYTCVPENNDVINRLHPYARAFAQNDTILEDVLNNYGEDIAFGLALNQYLYAQEDPSIKSDSAYTDFTSNSSFQEAIQVGEIVYDIRTAVNNSSISETDYENWTDAMEDALYNLYDILTIDSTEQFDTAVYTSTAYQNALTTIETLKDNFKTDIQTAQANLDQAIPGLISRLIGLNNFQISAAEHTRDMYIILLKYLSSDFTSFTASQKTTIDSISELCMYKYEPSVSLARSLRSLYDSIQDYSSYDAQCSDIGEAQSRSSVKRRSKIHVAVFPNPAQDILSLNFDAMIGNTTLYIYNIEGEMQKKIQIGEELKQLNIDISSLNSGIYYITDKHGTIAPTKFIKVK